MSDGEDGGAAPTPVVPSVEMDINTAIQQVLKDTLAADGLVRGLHECAKCLDKRQAHICIMAANCNEPNYVKLVEALCAEHSIPLMKVDDNKKLGEWAGLCKLDSEGHARKVVGCSCVVIREYGVQNQALDVVKTYLKSSK